MTRCSATAFWRSARAGAGFKNPVCKGCGRLWRQSGRTKELLRLSCVLRDDVHRALIHQRACEFSRPEPACLNGFSREAYALLFALSCLEQGLGALERRGIMRERYEAVCRRMADKQMDKLQRTGSALIEDYPWDMNFYGCAIFLCDRFYFIPYKWEGPCVYRRANDGRCWRCGRPGAVCAATGSWMA